MAWRADRVIKVICIAAIAVAIAFGLHVWSRFVHGIDVCVRNVDSEPLRAGEVGVRSSTATKLYAIGDLAPHARACVEVHPEGEASIDVTFKGTKPIPLDGYVESDNHGTVSADVTAAGARTIKRDITIF